MPAAHAVALNIDRHGQPRDMRGHDLAGDAERGRFAAEPLRADAERVDFLKRHFFDVRNVLSGVSGTDLSRERFFGEGPCRLLHRIEETGSLRAAAQAMGLSYSKALRMVKRAEKELGFALTRKTIGGRGGGGSTLTDEARNFMERYEAYRDACVQTDRELYYKFFPGER